MSEVDVIDIPAVAPNALETNLLQHPGQGQFGCNSRSLFARHRRKRFSHASVVDSSLLALVDKTADRVLASDRRLLVVNPLRQLGCCALRLRIINSDRFVLETVMMKHQRIRGSVGLDREGNLDGSELDKKFVVAFRK